MLSPHPPFLIAGQKIIDIEHGDKKDKNNKSGPVQKQPKTGDGQKQILRMPDFAVKAYPYYAVAGKPPPVKRDSGGKEQHQADDQSHLQVGDGINQRVVRKHHVRQKEFSTPAQ